MNTKGIMTEAQAIAQATKYGVISYDQARRKVLPLFAEVNKRGMGIARKYYIRYKQVTFTSLVS